MASTPAPRLLSTRASLDADEDVRVQNVKGIDDQRPGDPGDIPDQHPRIGVVQASDAPEVKRHRSDQKDREDSGAETTSASRPRREIGF